MDKKLYKKSLYNQNNIFQQHNLLIINLKS